MNPHKLYILLVGHMTTREMSRIGEKMEIFRIVGIINDSKTKTEEEEEISDISFERLRDIQVVEQGRVIQVTTRTGGGNRLKYKENIRDIKDHSLYLGNYDDKKDNTYAHWFFMVPPQKIGLIKLYIQRAGVNIATLPVITNHHIRSKLYNPMHADTDDDTDYSSEEGFKKKYGYWYDTPGDVDETDDEMSSRETSSNSGDSGDEMIDDLAPGMEKMSID